jgi:hypothetical protein
MASPAAAVKTFPRLPPKKSVKMSILNEKHRRIVMSVYADFALYDRNGRLIAVAQVKNKSGTSREWAAKLRRNILAHGGFHSADFFLLLTPDKLYVWKGAGAELAVVLPAIEVDAQPIFKPYFERAGVNPADVSGRAFELNRTT